MSDPTARQPDPAAQQRAFAHPATTRLAPPPGSRIPRRVLGIQPVLLVGIVLMQVVANLINRLGLTNSNWQAIVNGGLLLVVAVAQVYLSRVQARARREEADVVDERPERKESTTP